MINSNILRILFLFILSNGLINSIYGQVNYYNFNEIQANSSAYSTNIDRTLFYAPDNYVYFCNSLGIICRYQSNPVSQQPVQVFSSQAAMKLNTPITFGDNKIFYIDYLGQLRTLYLEAGIWRNWVLNYNAPSAKGDCFVFGENSTLFYTNNASEVCRMYWNGSIWSFEVFTTKYKAKSNSSFVYGDSKLIYIDIDSRIRNLYLTGSTWNNFVLNAAAPLSINSGLSFNTNSTIYYTSINNSVCQLKWSGTNWNFESCKLVTNIEPTTKLISNGDEVYYRDIDGKLCVLYKSDCRWFSRILNTNNISKINTALAYGNSILYYFNSANKILGIKSGITSNSQFVYVKGRKFALNSSDYYPMVINYDFNIYTDDEVNYWVGKNHSYYSNNQRCPSQLACEQDIISDFNNLKSRGFNSIRVTGLQVFAEENWNDDNLKIAILKGQNMTLISKTLTTNFENEVFGNLINKVLSLAQQCNLKVILVTGDKWIIREDIKQLYSDYLNRTALRYKNNISILAYDLINEPGRFWQLVDYDKNYICSLSSNWYNSIRVNDINHLITIGTQGISDAERWDPQIISVDFVSSHIYPYQKPWEVIYSELYWMNNVLLFKPWIIGETGFCAFNAPDICSDNNLKTGQYGWGSELKQKEYADLTILKSRGCGCYGYSWWTFHDVYYGDGPEDFHGLFTRCHKAKPVANSFILNAKELNCSNCSKPSDEYYYNKFNSTYKVIGKLIDLSGKPVIDGYIQGANINWTGGGTTLSKGPDGSFELCSNYLIHHLKFCGIGKLTKELKINTNQNIFDVGNVVLSDVTCSASLQTRKIHKQVEENLEVEDLIIYPNPTTGKVMFKNNITNEFISEFYDLKGENVTNQVHIYEKMNGEAIYDLGKLCNGFYIVKVNYNNKNYIKKILLNN